MSAFVIPLAAIEARPGAQRDDSLFNLAGAFQHLPETLREATFTARLAAITALPEAQRDDPLAKLADALQHPGDPGQGGLHGSVGRDQRASAMELMSSLVYGRAEHDQAASGC
ncbi:hypothetical protein [Burkholderia sp. Bp8986]|uniref:hypothetical protein n=1 Tax=Burkholderia sp. Bp8986 TaxID=2184550 RepID=UPI000F5A5B6D|nr:hypothetical protein [Burkholderia sp. Bp8986]RQS44914.1 hypothetical protein DID99_33830 [Burkholderia sp. Bp8986]